MTAANRAAFFAAAATALCLSICVEAHYEIPVTVGRFGFGQRFKPSYGTVIKADNGQCAITNANGIWKCDSDITGDRQGELALLVKDQDSKGTLCKRPLTRFEARLLDVQAANKAEKRLENVDQSIYLDDAVEIKSRSKLPRSAMYLKLKTDEGNESDSVLRVRTGRVIKGKLDHYVMGQDINVFLEHKVLLKAVGEKKFKVQDGEPVKIFVPVSPKGVSRPRVFTIGLNGSGQWGVERDSYFYDDNKDPNTREEENQNADGGDYALFLLKQREGIAIQLKEDKSGALSAHIHSFSSKKPWPKNTAAVVIAEDANKIHFEKSGGIRKASRVYRFVHQDAQIGESGNVITAAQFSAAPGAVQITRPALGRIGITGGISYSPTLQLWDQRRMPRGKSPPRIDETDEGM